MVLSARRAFFSLLLLSLSVPASAGIMLTAEVYETPGLAGYQTYDVYASSPEGWINAFGFYGDGDGVTGPLHQGGIDDSAASMASDQLFGGLDDGLTDSRWLLDNNATVGFGDYQSDSSMTMVRAYIGGKRGTDSQRDTHRSLAFVRLVTNKPEAVRLAGDFMVNVQWSDGTSPGAVMYSVDTLLSDIEAGPAPQFDSWPDVPSEVVAERQRQAEEQAIQQAARERVYEQQRLDEEKQRLIQEQRLANQPKNIDLEQQLKEAEARLLEQQKVVEQLQRAVEAQSRGEATIGLPIQENEGGVSSCEHEDASEQVSSLLNTPIIPEVFEEVRIQPTPPRRYPMLSDRLSLDSMVIGANIIQLDTAPTLAVRTLATIQMAADLQPTLDAEVYVPEPTSVLLGMIGLSLFATGRSSGKQRHR